MRVDTTVVETDVHHLTDRILLGDGVRVEHCARTWNGCAAFGRIAKRIGTATPSENAQANRDRNAICLSQRRVRLGGVVGGGGHSNAPRNLSRTDGHHPDPPRCTATPHRRSSAREPDVAPVADLCPTHRQVSRKRRWIMSASSACICSARPRTQRDGSTGWIASASTP
jgi:hypothetical protein